MPKRSCIRSVNVFVRIELLRIGDNRLQRKQRFGAENMLDGICISKTGIISDGRTDERTDTRWENNTSPLMCDGV